MKELSAMLNQVWLIANNKEAEFELFCAFNDLDVKHPESLRMFKNENTVEEVIK